MRFLDRLGFTRVRLEVRTCGSRQLRMLGILSMAAVILASAPGSGAAQGTDKLPRFALLVANSQYDNQSFSNLENPKHDIDLVADTLRKIGFPPENIVEVPDATAKTLRDELRRHVDRLKASAAASPGETIGVFYYSGHGAAAPANTPGAEGNYIIPIGTGPLTNTDFWQGAVGLTEIRMTLEEAKDTKQLVIFDACRELLKLPSRGTLRGFEAVLLPQDMEMLFAFATAPNERAWDSWQHSHNSPYALALSQELMKPGLDHLHVFSNVRIDVMNTTKGSQVPWIHDGLLQPMVFYLAPLTRSDKCPPATQLTAPEPIAWSEIPDKRSITFKVDTYTYEREMKSARRIEEVDEDTTHFIAPGTKIYQGVMNGVVAWYRYRRDVGSHRERYVFSHDVELN